jgi:hypothetical protein
MESQQIDTGMHNGGSAASGALKLVTQSDSRSNRLRGDSAAGPRFQSALIDMR